MYIESIKNICFAKYQHAGAATRVASFSTAPPDVLEFNPVNNVNRNSYRAIFQHYEYIYF